MNPIVSKKFNWIYYAIIEQENLSYLERKMYEMIPAGLIQIESLLKFEIKAKHWNPNNSLCWYTKNMQI